MTELSLPAYRGMDARELRPRPFSQRWQNIAGIILVTIFVSVAITADWLAPHQDIYWTDALKWPGDKMERTPHGPSDLTLLGTIPVPVPHRQMDVYTALIRGTRSALIFGLSAAAGAALIGVLLGAGAAFSGGWLGALVMRATDALLAMPVIVGVFLVDQLAQVAARNPAALQAGGFRNILLSLLLNIDPVLAGVVLFSWMPYARIIHGMVLRVNRTEFVEAARALGAGRLRMIFMHILPNAISPAVVIFSRDIGGMVLLQATLTFIEMGNGSAWGEMLVFSRHWIIGPGGDILRRWWMFLPATAALVLFGMSWNLLGDGLNEWMNPRER